MGTIRVVSMLLCFLFAGPSHAQSSRADLNLVIAMDCSWSVNSAEFALQLGGISSAFADPIIIKAIEEGRHGRINVLLVQWSETSRQIAALPWTTIFDGSSAISYANRVASSKRLMADGGTSIVGALQFSQNAFSSAPLLADRSVIDVIADGENNQGGRVENKRDQIVALDTTINALAVVNEVGYLHHYLRNRVIGGHGSFVERAADYRDFKRAFLRKLLREIQGPLFSETSPRKYSQLHALSTAE